MAKVHMVVVPLLYLALLVSPIMVSECFVSKSKVVCLHSEKQALLNFNLQASSMLSTWISEDDECCKWYGVVCDNVTGHVLELQLGNINLSGKISPSLLNLKHLTHLNLSYNRFDGIQIPSFLGSLVTLTHLDLKDAGLFVGMIPPQLGNLSNLDHLSIGSNNGNLYSKNLDWLSGLSSLEHLEIGFVNLSEASSNLLSPINKLSSLLVLRMHWCDLHNIHLPSSLVLKNLTYIQLLDLSFNNFEGPSLCNVLDTMTHLQYLDLSYNSLKGKLPSSLESRLCKLVDLKMSYNQYGDKLDDAIESLSGCLSNNLHSLDVSNNLFTGETPVQIGEFKKLTTINLHHNKLSGPLPESLGSLSNLKYLDISSNLMQGVVTEVHLANLTNLKIFDASGNSLTLNVNQDWIPHFNLDILKLSDWKLGPRFSTWLKTQKNISNVDFSNTGIADVIPNWFHNFSSQLTTVKLSHNHLYGVIPIWFWNFTSKLDKLILSHNHLEGVVPNDTLSIKYIDLSFNELTGPLPRISSEVWSLDLSSNSFSGEISRLLCNHTLSGLQELRLGDNLLTGNIPNCLEHWTQLLVLDLRSNFLVGKIPTSIGLLSRLNSLSLGNNNLTGDIPTSLKNCSMLEVLNLGRNRLFGIIPRWIGRILYLSVLILRSNRVNGDIPAEFCALSLLQILDVADNNLHGLIPHCFLSNKFAATPTEVSTPFFYTNFDYGTTKENAVLVTKGKENQYESIIRLVTTIDLSSNNLSGEIPEELTNLQGLRFLNLSRNHLRGSIPNKIGNMTSLESLDLSWNKLSGDIPPSMSSLTSLNFLNLSHNNLSGEIPKSTQLQSLNSSSFDGNQLLCGDPLPKQCRPKVNKTSLHTDSEDDDNDKEDGEEYWFRLGVAVGFGVGFLGIIAPLVLCGFWRRAYFWFFQEYIWYQILDCIIKIKYITGIR